MSFRERRDHLSASEWAARGPRAGAAPLVITTSWDDGHPCDMPLADLLERFRLSATFYVPRYSQRPTLADGDVCRLSQRFELGAHTVDHIRLTTLSDATARQQIVASKAWAEDLSGEPCLMFCPPQGAFSQQHLQMFEEIGFVGYRTVEFGSLAGPQPRGGCLEMPTTVQAHPHSVGVYFRNAVRRRRVSSVLFTLLNARSSSWTERAGLLLAKARAVGGVFHLWGHSWEIDENDQWGPLEDMLRLLSELVAAGLATTSTNGQLCDPTPAAATCGAGDHVAR